LRGGLARWQAKLITSYIEDKLDSSIRVTALAGVVQLSTSHFFRAFRKTFGETPVAYIRQRRVRRAQELMLTSRLSLSQVALECGMCDQPHLCRVFRRIVGVNPNAWRRQLPVGPAPRQFRRPANPDSEGAMSPGFGQIAKRAGTHR
jgi:AraC family transcriptional regulator